VEGKCTFPTSGYTVDLKPAKPQGINPKIFILEKIVHKPTGPAQDVITTVSVRYEEKTETRYTEIEIVPDGTQFPVKEVH